MQIRVTQEDIDKGKRNSLRRCPVALALKRACGRIVEVGSTMVYSRNEDRAWLISLPEKAEDFVKLFDIGEPVEPFTFDLPLE